MKSVAFALLPGCMAPKAAAFASLPSHLFDETGVGAGIVLTLLGTVLNIYLPRLQMSAEEQVKDRELTEEEARQRIRFCRRCGFFMTLTGVLVLVFVMLDLISRAGD